MELGRGGRATGAPVRDDGGAGLPGWVPDAVLHYLEHVEQGTAIRALARRSQVHASTVLRQVRRLESRRDDPLVDAALRRLARRLKSDPPGEDATRDREAEMRERVRAEGAPAGTGSEDAARQVLRRLAEPGAVLAVAPGMAQAAVVHDDGGGEARCLIRLDRELAELLALRGWIAPGCAAGRVGRYRLSPAGRAQLRLPGVASPGGFAEAPRPFAAGGPRQPHAAATDSPLVALARRRDRDGQPFLGRELVAAGARLREDFELAEAGPRLAQDWDRFLTGPSQGTGTGRAPDTARDRLAAALADLGPGLGDVALRCCCYLEGLESLEKRMGWSARSGKIVLRIALQRLRRHYDHVGGNDMIG
ncbi:hypothetical protein SAMN04488567_0928 [Limimaricola pyoseonensis]|uniref:DUF6456 domain-containing protein n=1 Tax=Limimaricola pyoseonensis TaxID=521013 RepID=A0A1G7AEY1_9RHOB|nr:hypothetical protein SAMN04488567_0928 [Limimaricola pyoseonensis]